MSSMEEEHDGAKQGRLPPFELPRRPSAHAHPLQNVSSVADYSKGSPLARVNGDTAGVPVTEAALRRQLSLAPMSGRLEDDKTEKDFEDPLLSTSFSHDPLSNPLGKEDARKILPRSSRRVVKSASDERAESAAAEWDSYKPSIMQRFTSSGTITVSTTFDIISKDPKGRGKSLSATHLQQLEDPEKEAQKEVKIISQQEYVTRLRELNEEISQAWVNNERVAALRLSIKVARLLSDASVPQFYPTLFVLVTDVMDTVGNLVWNRIKKKSECDDEGNVIATLPINFTADDVRQEAKDTCNNWFFRIGSIKELLPRMLFLQNGAPYSIFQRLTMMIRGVADPLTSAYVRLYLVRRAEALLPPEMSSSESLKSYSALLRSQELLMPPLLPEGPRVCLIRGMKDYLVLFQRVLAGEFDAKYIGAGVDLRLYVMLTEPVVEWIMHCIFKNADQETMVRILDTFREAEAHDQSIGADVTYAAPFYVVSVVVHYLLKNLPATFVGNHALYISKMVGGSADLSMPQYLNYRLFGGKLCECSPPREFRLAVLNNVWRIVLKYSDLAEYLSVADVFIEYILQNCSEVELGVMLRDISRHLKKAQVTDGVLVSLESIVFKLVTHYTDLSHVLTLAHFIDILDVLYGDTRISVYKRILSGVSRRNQQVRDPITRHFVFEAAKALHDSLDSLSSDDDRRQITQLVARFVQLADFGHDVEQHLAFLVDCRGNFADMDPLRVTVVHASNRLAMMTLRMVKGSHTTRTTDFVKACIAFNEITIPSINSVVARSNLFLESAEVALMNTLPSHTEGLLMGALTGLHDVPSKDDSKPGDRPDAISLFLNKASAFLIVVPGHLQEGPFFIVRSLLNLLDSRPRLTSGRSRVQVLCSILSMLVALGQDPLPYHVQNKQLDSNDVLYYGDADYQQDLESLKDSILDKILSSVSGEVDHSQKTIFELDVCNVLLQVFDVQNVRDVCVTLLQNVRGSLKSTNHRYFQSTLEFCRRKDLDIQTL